MFKSTFVCISLSFFLFFLHTKSCLIWIIFNWSIWPIDGTWTGMTTPGQSESGSNDNKRVLHYPELQNWSLTIICSLASCPENLFFERERGLTLLQKDTVSNNETLNSSKIKSQKTVVLHSLECQEPVFSDCNYSLYWNNKYSLMSRVYH